VLDEGYRKTFNGLSGLPFESGGVIDFGRNGRLERFSVIRGDEDSVESPSPDFEVEYHTHPDEAWLSPSEDDLAALINSPNQQAEIILRNGDAIVIKKTNKSPKKVDMGDLKEWDERFTLIEDNALRRVGWNGGSISKGLIERVRGEVQNESIKFVRSLGFDVDKVGKGGFKIDGIKPVEGRKVILPKHSRSSIQRFEVIHDQARKDLGLDPEVERRKWEIKELRDKLRDAKGFDKFPILDQIAKKQGLI